MACLVKILRNFHEWSFALAHWSDDGVILPAVHSCKESFPQSGKRPRAAGKPGGHELRLLTASYHDFNRPRMIAGTAFPCNVPNNLMR